MKYRVLIQHITQQTNAEGGVTQWAQNHGVTPQAVWRVLNGDGTPGNKLLKEFGLRMVPTWEVVNDDKEEWRA